MNQLFDKMKKEETYFDCEFHGKVKAKIIEVETDLKEKTIKIRICCPICYNIENNDKRKIA